MVPFPSLQGKPPLEGYAKRRASRRIAVWSGVACACVVLLVGSVLALVRYGLKSSGREEAIRPATPVESGAGGSAVDRAVAKGVLYLKRQQTARGAWGEMHAVGLASLATLALLESGVPANDSHVQKSLQFVREGVPALDKTYELALAILLLDRLKQPQDDEQIRSMVLRLTAGQTQAGGWSYTCPIMPLQEERGLLVALQRTSPVRPADLFVQGPDGQSLSRLFSPAPRLVGTLQGDDSGSRPSLRTDPTIGDLPESQPPSAQEAIMALRESRRGLPALQTSDKPSALPDLDDSDNSNTQFAALALWASRHRGVPVGRALAQVVSRFRNSQKPTGGWGYLYQSSEAAAASWDTTTASMTGVGLICLAVGWGLADTGTLQPGGDQSLRDPAILKGLDTLGGSVEFPSGRRAKAGEAEPPLDLYYLWTLERVGVLYDVRTLGGKDWWTWGAGQILGCQRRDGSWDTNGYRGARPVTDTCFALLFLKRADMAYGLSGQIKQLHLVQTIEPLPR